MIRLVSQSPPTFDFEIKDGDGLTRLKVWFDEWNDDDWSRDRIETSVQRYHEAKSLNYWLGWFGYKLHSSEAVSRTIPADKRTKPLGKAKVANLLGRGGNTKRAVEWLNKCIDDGTIRFQPTTRQSGFYHLDDFPSELRERLKP